MKNILISKYILALTDFFSFIISYLLGLLLLGWGVGDLSRFLPMEQFGEATAIHLIVATISVIWYWIRLRHYTYRKPFWFELKETLRTLVILFIIELAIIAFSKIYLSRYLWVTIWIATLIILPINRILLKKCLIKMGLYLKNTIIIGGGPNAIDAYYALNSESYLGFKVKYFLSSHPSEELSKFDIPIMTDVEKGGLVLLSNPHDQFIIALEDNENIERDYWLRYLSKNNYRSVSVIPSLRGLPLYSTDMSFLFSYDVMLLRINNNLAKRSSRLIKRITDIILSINALIVLSPLFLYLYFLIKKDGGDVIYRHKRVGMHGKEFWCLKFRTMVPDSSEILEDLLLNDEKAKQEWQKDFKLKNDPRITPIGAFLRKTSLDELPQLWNVLKGEMSLVGPRPIVAQELERYKEEVDYYLMTKPGMTGLWQISG